jgi:hypothetical protein
MRKCEAQFAALSCFYFTYLWCFLLNNQFPILHNHFKQKRIETIVAMSVYEFDDSKWLHEAIKSIQCQTYRHFLFVIVIDGPVPRELESVLLDAAGQDEQIVLLQNEENCGGKRTGSKSGRARHAVISSSNN